jgi:hypothetical protein
MPDRPIFLSRLALPVSWEALDHAPSLEDCAGAAAGNAGVISFLLHGVDLDAAPHPSDESLLEALAPLRIKLDIVIEMLGRLTYRGFALPPAREMELGTSRIAWTSPRPVRSGEWLRIKLYFDPKFLEPVVLHGQVTSALGDAATGDCSVQAEFGEIPPETEEAFARLVFLAQRRQLAQRVASAGRDGR